MQFVTGRVWPAMLTPLDDHGQPHLLQVDRLVELFAEQQLGGLFILGSTGQGVLLSSHDRRQIAERAVRAAAGCLPIMVHVGAVSTDEAVELARHAEQIGADAISSVPPIYYPVSGDVVFEHYRRIGSATGLPFYPYHAMFLRQSLPAAKQYAERLLEVPRIAGMKFTDHDLYLMGLLHRYSAGRLRILSGADELLCHAALSGADGAIGTFYNQWGPACQRARQAFVAGNIEAGRRFMATFQEVIDEILTSGAMWGFHRASMRQRYGIDMGPTKAPLGTAERPWSESQVEQLLARVDEAAP